MPARTIQSVRGVRDLLPDDVAAWRQAEDAVRSILEGGGYREFRVPIIEHAELYRRSVGEHTDIVQKEMYALQGGKGQPLTLRPEATAGIARAVLEHGLHRGRHRFWCAGPMFRRERPQRGRLRQFHQFDAEAVGYAGPDIDAELIALAARIFRQLGVEGLALEINSLGGPECRRNYRESLQAYFRDHHASLDADSQRRLDANPLRILDSRNPEMAALIDAAPDISEHLEPDSAEHFSALESLLEAAGLSWRRNPRLVRGLDYYTGTVFEFLADGLGAQNAVCAGGRYDGLMEQLGGPPTPAVGWAMGVERLMELASPVSGGGRTKAYLVLPGGPEVQRSGLRLAERLRNECPSMQLEMNCGGGGLGTQLRRAGRSGARYAVIVGERELAARAARLKDLRRESEQEDIPLADLARALEDRSSRTIPPHE